MADRARRQPTFLLVRLPEGFSNLFNGKDFSGWRAENPHDYVKLRDAKKIAAKREQDRRGVSHALADQRRGDSQ